MCIYYHASLERYSIGYTVSVDNFQGTTTRDHARRSLEQQLVNDLLDAKRPQDMYNRKRCIFLFDNLQHCIYYASKQYGEGVQIYRVHSDDVVWGGFPICVVNKVYNSSAEFRDYYISEYWSPTQRWKMYEFLARSIIIDEIINFQLNYYNDDYLDDHRTLCNLQCSY